MTDGRHTEFLSIENQRAVKRDAFLEMAGSTQSPEGNRPLSQVEEKAFNEKRMISNKEAQIRKYVGICFTLLGLLAYTYDPLIFQPWGFLTMFGVGIGFYRTGTMN